MDENWKVNTTICWGERDRWLSYDGVEDFCKESKHQLIKLPMVLVYDKNVLLSEICKILINFSVKKEILMSFGPPLKLHSCSVKNC